MSIFIVLLWAPTYYCVSINNKTLGIVLVNIILPRTDRPVGTEHRECADSTLWLLAQSSAGRRILVSKQCCCISVNEQNLCQNINWNSINFNFVKLIRYLFLHTSTVIFIIFKYNKVVQCFKSAHNSTYYFVNNVFVRWMNNKMDVVVVHK
jgi:hypothetical protein